MPLIVTALHEKAFEKTVSDMPWIAARVRWIALAGENQGGGGHDRPFPDAADTEPNVAPIV